MEEFVRMQENLLLIRRAVGWTAEDFGERIGVTRQTINNIESGRNKLTKTQYIAMRSMLDAEIAQAPEDTQMLQVLLEVFVDHPEKYQDKEREQLLAKANLMAPSILAGTAPRATVSKEWISAVGAIISSSIALGALLGTIGLGVGTVTTSTWLSKVISNSKKRPNKVGRN